MRYRSILELNHLPMDERLRVCRELIPPEIFRLFEIDPVGLENTQGEKTVQYYGPGSHGFASIDVKQKPDQMDSICFLQLSDTPFLENLELSFIVINDIRTRRFHIDRDAGGRDTLFGTASRNTAQEEMAMAAGLAPGQVFRGLRLLHPFIRCLERVASRMGCSMISAEALFYHNAFQYEMMGFGYLEGRKRMEEIDREFQTGGRLDALMDGSNLFRQKGAGISVRGRS